MTEAVTDGGAGSAAGTSTRSQRRRRRRGGAELEELVVAPGPDPAAWAPVLAEVLRDALGEASGDAPRVDPSLGVDGAQGVGPASGVERTSGLDADSGVGLASDVDAASQVEALPHHAGPQAHRIETSDGPLVVRVAEDRSQLVREAAAIGAVGSHGLGVPKVVGLFDLPGSPGGAAAALVTRPLPGMAFPDLMGFNLTVSDVLMTGFTRHQAAIHDLPVDGLEGVVPTVSLDDELGRIDRARFAEHLDWLVRNRPDPAPVVLCHGGYQPLCVAGPGKDEWDAFGGAGHGLSVGNWCGAVLAERELDVAFTLVAFWVAPHFASSRSERTAVKMIRPALANGYRKDYAAAAGLDQDRLRFWQAFHSVRGMARLAGAYDADGSPFEFTDRGPLPRVVAAELERFYRMQHRN